MNAPGSWHGRLALLASVAALLVLAGCGAKTGTLTGKVTYKGQPVSKATVTFLVDGGKASVTVKCDDQGVYSAKVPIGNAQVGVNNVDQAAPTMMGQMMAQQKGGKEGKGDIEQAIKSMQKEIGGGGSSVAVPGKYNTPETSGLTVEITGGKQTFDIPLSD